MKRLIALLTITLFGFSLFAADLSKIKFEYITVDDGLSQGVIEDILQDSQGYMWFATRDGLNRYDGREFIVFRNDRNDPQSLASNYISGLAEDKSGRIWIGSEGLNVYDPLIDKMTRITANPDNPDWFHGGGRVYSITVDNDSTVWICTGNGLVHYFPARNVYRTYLPDPGNPNSLGSPNVYSVCATRKNKLYVGTDEDNIYEYDRNKDAFTAIAYKLAYAGNNSIKYIQEDDQGLLYITSEFAGVHIYDPVSGEARLIDKTAGGLNAISIKTKVLVVGPNEIWIGTDGGGIDVYDPVTGAMQYLTADSRNSSSLSGNAIFRLFQDKDKNIWAGHFGTGLSVWKRNKEKFTSYLHSPFNPASINKEVVTAIFEDSKGRIWIGQDGGGLSLFNEREKSFEHIRYKDNDPASLTSDVILAINEDPDGNLLLGSYSGGFMVFDPDRKKVIRSYNSQNGLSSDHIWVIFNDSKERYWVALLSAGYSLYDPLTTSFQNYVYGTEGVLSCSNVVMSITEDNKGKIWFGTENTGFCVLDWDKKEIKSYRHDENNKNSVSYNDVKSIVFMGEYAWIATNGGGLNRLDLKTDSIKVYTMKDGLSSDALMGILPDDKENLWISSTRGIMKFNTVTEEVLVFDKTQGIQGNEFKYNAQYRLRDGRMMFGGINGLTIFHPDSIKVSAIAPAITFTNFRIFDKSVIPGIKGSPLKKHINYTEYIKLSNKQSVFSIDFASLDFTAPVKNRFMYMLDGFDEEWIDAGNRRSVTYTNLDAGKYVFLLKGSNSDGVWNENIRKITIRVKPSWYTTKLSIALYILALILGIIYYVKQREKQVIADKLILEKKIDEAQAELKSKTRKVEEHEEEIHRRDEDEREIRFQTEGIARMSDIIAKKRRNLEELSSSMISELVRYVDASAGGIFVLDDTDPFHVVLRATGEFCLSSDKTQNFAFEIGEGNIGSCYKDKQTLTFDNLPDGYVVMRSGLGAISLHHALFVPIMQDSVCVGVIEVASIEKLTENKVRFIEKIAESLASIIIIIKANEKSSQMIEQNNAQAEELRAQEEEMRQNMEELMATQEESQRKEKNMLEELATKDALIKKLKGAKKQ